MSSLRSTIAMAAFSAITLVSCSTDGRTMQEPTQSQIAAISPGATSPTQGEDVIEQTAPLTLTAPWTSGATLDARYSCDGEAISPPLAWTSALPEAKAFGIVLTDRDQPDYVHWVITNIDPSVTTINENSNPPGAFVATNSEKKRGYAAPCPPTGSTHSYTIMLYALSALVDTTRNSDAPSIIEKMNAVVLEVGTTDFTYSR
jgi:Raf kinase inhibitor-like YbhB/YbcL family protein